MTTHRTGCAALRHTTAGNERPWQHRQSDHLRGMRRHWHGPIQPMEYPGFFARLFTVSREKLARSLARGR